MEKNWRFLKSGQQEWGKEGDKEYERVIQQEMDKVAPPWTEERPLVERHVRSQEEEYGSMDGPFVMSEFKRALQICREKSSPGLDGIDYHMLKLLFESFKYEI